MKEQFTAIVFDEHEHGIRIFTKSCTFGDSYEDSPEEMADALRSKYGAESVLAIYGKSDIIARERLGKIL